MIDFYTSTEYDENRQPYFVRWAIYPSGNAVKLYEWSLI